MVACLMGGRVPLRGKSMDLVTFHRLHLPTEVQGSSWLVAPAWLCLLA